MVCLPFVLIHFFIKYADDVSISHLVRESTEDHLQSEWDHIADWSIIRMFWSHQEEFIPPITLSNGTFLSGVSTLFSTFTEDMKWNAYVDKIFKISSTSLLLHAFPVCCNASEYLLYKLSSLERRAVCIIGCNFILPFLFDVADKCCFNMMHAIESMTSVPCESCVSHVNVLGLVAVSVLLLLLREHPVFPF